MKKKELRGGEEGTVQYSKVKYSKVKHSKEQ